MEKNALSIIKTQKYPAPSDWHFEKFEDTGENFYSGKFRASGYVIDVQDFDHPETPVHFMLCADKPSGNRLALNTNEFGGCGGYSPDAQGHTRLFHLFENEELPIDPDLLDQLAKARDLGHKIVIYGRTVAFDLEDRSAQAAAFNGWDRSNRCPVVTLDKVVKARPPESLLSKIKREFKFAAGIR